VINHVSFKNFPDLDVNLELRGTILCWNLGTWFKQALFNPRSTFQGFYGILKDSLFNCFLVQSCMNHLIKYNFHNAVFPGSSWSCVQLTLKFIKGMISIKWSCKIKFDLFNKDVKPRLTSNKHACVLWHFYEQLFFVILRTMKNKNGCGLFYKPCQIKDKHIQQWGFSEFSYVSYKKI
jgi:hypothetical protein